MSEKLSVNTKFGRMEAHTSPQGFVFVIGSGEITVNNVRYRSCRCEVIRQADGTFKPNTVYDPALTRADGKDTYSFPAREKVAAELCKLAADIAAKDPHIFTRAKAASLREEANSLAAEIYKLAERTNELGRQRGDCLREAEELEASVGAIGTMFPADKIGGHPMQLFEGRDDIKHFLEVFVSAEVRERYGITFDNATGVIITGHHESSPDAIWATIENPANHINANYVLVYKSEA